MDAKSKSPRMLEIISVLTKYGIADWLKKTDVDWIKERVTEKVGKEILEKSREERIRLAFTELGTTFIKLGQILSTRSDLVGSELAEELTRLQADVPRDKIGAIRTRVRTELGIKSMDEAFENFETKPIASASIAQVHSARLVSGEDVVVKVMHEGVEEKVIEDLKIMAKLAQLADRIGGEIGQYQPVQLTREFSAILMDELDFNVELKNINRFKQNFADDERVVFPDAFEDFSGKRVLTMSFVEGTPLQKMDQLDWNEEEKNRFTEMTAEIFMEMMFRDRFYHSDPHPGNLLAREDGSLGVIDCGMVGRVDPRTKDIMEDVILAVAHKDGEQLKNLILDMGVLPKGLDYDSLTLQLDAFIDQYIDLPMNEFDMTTAIEDMTGIIREHRIILPANVSSLFRMFTVLEGSSRLLNPVFNLSLLFENYQFKILQRRLSPRSLFMKLFQNLNQWETIFELTPKVIGKFLRQGGKDDFKIGLEHQNLERSVNRMVVGLIAAAIFMGSSLLWAFKVPPQIEGYSVVGIAGIVISSVLIFRLLSRISKDS